MAYTRIHAIKATVQKALKYICNSEKTDGELLIDSFACGIETAHFDFKMHYQNLPAWVTSRRFI